MSDTAHDSSAHKPQPGAEAPGIGEAVEALGQAGRESLHSTLEMARAMRRLVAADIALARAALARAAVWMAVAVVFGSSAWLLLMAALIALLVHFGMSTLAATSVSALISLVIAAFGAWKALQYFEMGKFDATRRQLAKLGIGDGDNPEEEDEPDFPAPRSEAPQV
jgi:uncharacterized membrane protein YqjE